MGWFGFGSPSRGDIEQMIVDGDVDGLIKNMAIECKIDPNDTINYCISGPGNDLKGDGIGLLRLIGNCARNQMELEGDGKTQEPISLLAEAVEPLIVIIEENLPGGFYPHDDSHLLRMAAELLGIIGDPRPVPILVTVMKGLWEEGIYFSNFFNRQVAAETLDKLAWEPDTDELCASYLFAKRDIDGCIKLGEPGVELIRKALEPSNRIGMWTDGPGTNKEIEETRSIAVAALQRADEEKQEEKKQEKEKVRERKRKAREEKKQEKEKERKRKLQEEKKRKRQKEKRRMLSKAQDKEKHLDYDGAIAIYEEIGHKGSAKRVRKLKAEQGAVKVDQTVVHGDYIDDRDTIVKDSVISKSNIGAGGKSKMQELREVKALLDDGIIDDAEFQQMKKEILGK